MTGPNITSAVASGGVWKTVNGGTTWTPVFDNEGSFSIGAIALDPKNPATVWVGTGENNSQRSVGYGDGVYRSDDGGRSWRNVGLKTSEHIGKIAIDPRDSNVVFVAAQGPLWSAGGERGLYKTTDGGKTWKAVITSQRKHRRDGRRDRSVQSRYDVRRFMAAAAAFFHADQRRPGKRDLQIDRWRQHLDKAPLRSCLRAISDASAFRSRRQIPMSFTQRSRQPGTERYLSLKRPRGDMGTHKSEYRPGHVLRPDRCRSEKCRSHLYPKCRFSGFG